MSVKIASLKTNKKASKKVSSVTQDVLESLATSHGITKGMLPEIVLRSTQDERERLLEQQRDTVAYQWMNEFVRVEILSRTCIYCNFTAKTRLSLRTHMRRHGDFVE